VTCTQYQEEVYKLYEIEMDLDNSFYRADVKFRPQETYGSTRGIINGTKLGLSGPYSLTAYSDKKLIVIPIAIIITPLTTAFGVIADVISLPTSIKSIKLVRRNKLIKKMFQEENEEKVRNPAFQRVVEFLKVKIFKNKKSL
jgi:hypothetical protein